MLKIRGRQASELSPTELSHEDFKEDDLREWIIGNTDAILGEKLLIIGREVGVADLGDGIDLLAIDRDGNLVVVELKRGALRGSVDFQSLKYVSYVSRWSYDEIKSQFEMFAQNDERAESYEEDVSFSEILEKFCNDDYELNGSQRIILVGSSVHERIGSVVLWLRQSGIDISIVQFSLHKDEDEGLFLDSKTIVPTSDLEKFQPGSTPADEPWKRDGRRWHLEERANEDTAVVIQRLIEALSEIEELEGPHWEQKFYIAFRIGGTNRVLLRTRAQSVHLMIYDFPATEDELSTFIQEAIDLVSDPELVAGTEGTEDERSNIRLKLTPELDLDYEEIKEFVFQLIFKGQKSDSSTID